MRISVKEAADQLGMAEQAVRILVQRKILPIGEAVRYKGNNYTYYIQQELLDKYLGKKEQERREYGK